MIPAQEQAELKRIGPEQADAYVGTVGVASRPARPLATVMVAAATIVDTWVSTKRMVDVVEVDIV